MSPTVATTSTHVAPRPSVPREYVVPVVRPLPERPAGTAPDDTW